jgi:hypothetical protein
MSLLGPFWRKKEELCDGEEKHRSQKRCLYALGNPEKHVHSQPLSL